ncbi:endonuclease/exonuclease/phosphatase family protein [Agriterribacter sp.]|uniref:endonuclease/exonuclease/phosphatase family protein n=1 Tax=Agriterribacter sp. TaxID=2821509 RepID=UPI002B8FDA8C|nr:endonuclease/exonuclease/phosphatase family protein [Agriterribacter sp.]HRO44550.1 endonuclease/exonuclease/phosphatase family protein [Agriterribacter sp.]HRQ15987.1 endonuclease/exonuclease/phosphatase family protein [Agriterribacter sp.]
MVRTFIRRFLLIVYLVVVVVFLTACLSPFLNPATWWFFGFLGLAFPYLLIILLVFLAVWIFARSRWSWLAIIALLLGWKNIASVFAFHPFSSFDKEKKAAGTLRIMTWNIKSFFPPEDIKNRKTRIAHRESIFGVIRDYDPDIIAIQEFYGIESVKWFNNLTYLREMGYRYYYFPGDFERYRDNYSGTAIFSKYPIVYSARTNMPQNGEDKVESLLKADIIYNADTISVFTAHLQSYRFMPEDYSDLSKIRNDPNERIDASKNIVRKMRVAFKKRGVQTDIIRRQLDESAYPEIFCGDLNDVPNSYAYFSVKNNKRDAFIAGGFGFGQTFYNFSSNFMRRLPTLRIDYIFTDPRFTIKQCTRVPVILSDHIPVVADIQLNAK